MKNIQKIVFQAGSKEELLPDFAHDFPYIASRVEMLPLLPDNPAHAAVLEQVKAAFSLSPDGFGYEMRLRAIPAGPSGYWIERKTRDGSFSHRI